LQGAFSEPRAVRLPALWKILRLFPDSTPSNYP